MRVPETELIRCSMKEFVQCARAWRDKGVYLQDDVALERSGGGSLDDDVPPPVTHVPGGGGVGQGPWSIHTTCIEPQLVCVSYRSPPVKSTCLPPS